MKSTFAQSVAKVASSMGYGNVRVDWDYNQQPGRTVGVYATLSANGKTSSPIAIGMLAYYYNVETNTDGPSGQVYSLVANAINTLFQS
ncbi:MAG: hypothetical protein HC888_07205 [Candidatus Competibacteraceae bacterium]|nr:hypothetical protein [Candidatus Competibacteraceae bacterium]